MPKPLGYSRSFKGLNELHEVDDPDSGIDDDWRRKQKLFSVNTIHDATPPLLKSVLRWVSNRTGSHFLSKAELDGDHRKTKLERIPPKAEPLGTVGAALRHGGLDGRECGDHVMGLLHNASAWV